MPSVAPPLALTSPMPDARFAAGQPVVLSIDCDFAAITRVDHRVDGVIVASATAAPWTATWDASGLLPESTVVAEVRHGTQIRTLSPPVRIGALDPDGRIFRHGFED